MDDDQPIPFIRERNKSHRYSKGRRVSTESTSSTDSNSLSMRSSTSSSSLQYSYSVNSQSESLAIKERAFSKMEQHQEEIQRMRMRHLQINSQSEPSLNKLPQRLSLEEFQRASVRQLRQRFEDLNGDEQIIFKTSKATGWRLQQPQNEVTANSIHTTSIHEVASEDEVDDFSDNDDEFETCTEEMEAPPPPPSTSPPISTPSLSREQSKLDDFGATNLAVVNAFIVGAENEPEYVNTEKNFEGEGGTNKVLGENCQTEIKKRAPDFPRNYRSTPRPKTELIGTTNRPDLHKHVSCYHTNHGEEECEEAVLREKNERIVLARVQPILDELIKTEETYVENLRIGIASYGNIFSRKDLPMGLRGKKFVLLGNIEQLAEFHRNEFLPMLLRNKDDLKRLFDEFSVFIDDNCFYGYVLFTMNKKRSLKLCETYKDYFKRLQTEIDDKLGINSFLVQPIQRMARYPLLLNQFMTTLFKHCDFHFKPVIEACCKLEKKVRTLLTMTNESEVINDIVECNDFNVFYQGKFRKVSEFYVFDHTLKRGYRSKVFIFDKCIIYTEIKDKRLVFRGCYPCERIGIIAKQKSFTLFYQKRKTQECDFNTDQAQCEHWLELITNMISSFATEERRKLKEKYSKENDHAHRRPPSLSQFRNSNRFSSDSGIGNMWSLPKASDETKEESSNRTTWYART